MNLARLTLNPKLVNKMHTKKLSINPLKFLVEDLKRVFNISIYSYGNQGSSPGGHELPRQINHIWFSFCLRWGPFL